MDESRSKVDGLTVSLGDVDNPQSQYNDPATTVATNKKVIDKIRRLEDEGDGLNIQQIDQLKQNFLEEDSVLDDNVHVNSQGTTWSEGAHRATQDVPAQSQNSQQVRLSNTAKKDTSCSQLVPAADPLVSETQLDGLFEDTQFNNGFTKPAQRNGSTDAQHIHGQLFQSQDTQYVDDLKQRLLEEETQVLVGDSQPQAEAEGIKDRGDTEVDKNIGEAERDSIKEPEPERQRIPSQEGETQFIEGIKAQVLDSIVDSQDDNDTSQIDDTAQEKTIFTENCAEIQGAGTQGSDQVVLFPIGTSFGGGGGIEYTQSQLPSQDAQGRSFVAPIYSYEQSGADQMPAQLLRYNLPNQSTSNFQSDQNNTFPSLQPKTTDRLATASNTKQTKHKTSKKDINTLKHRAMDDWFRDSLGTASQTQANDSGPRYAAASAKSQSQPQSQNHEGSVTKKIRSSNTHTQSSSRDAHSSGRREDEMDVDRTYNENESGAVRLDFTQGQAEESQNLQVSQDGGLKNPSYDFARQTRDQDDTSQLEPPETPPTGSKNPFAKSRSAVPMGMSQVFAATQSSPLDPRFLQSEGIRPSSPCIAGLGSSPAVRRAQTLPAEASSPSHVELTVASSFQPFDESTQSEPVRNARLGKWKAEPVSQKRTEAQYAHFFVGRTDPGDLRFTETEENRRRSAEPAKQKKPVTYKSDDGMDIEEENRKRIAAKRLKDKMEKNLREVGDMATGPRNTSPSLDCVRRAASTGRVIVKNDVRGARLRERQRQSLEGTTSAQDKTKKIEEVEVPASGEASKASTTRRKSRKNRNQSEEYRAQSECVDARDTQGTDPQVIRSSQPRRSSRPEVVVDSQANISTQAMSSPPGSSIPVTSSGHYLKKYNSNSTPGGSKGNNDTAPEVVPETSPPSKTASPDKPFNDLSQVVDSPMKSFDDFPMTQEPPNQIDPSDITPRRFVKNTQKVYGKKNSVKKRPEQKMAKRSTVIFTQEPSEPSDNEQEYVEVETPTKATPVEEPVKAKRAPKKPAAAKKAETSVKSANLVDEEDVMDFVTPGKAKKGEKKAAAASKAKPTMKSVERVVDSDEDAEEVITPANDKNATPQAAKKSARFAVDEEEVEKVVTPVKKGRKTNAKVVSPPVPEKPQLFCTQGPLAQDDTSEEITRNRATKKTTLSPTSKAYPSKTPLDEHGYHDDLDKDRVPYSPQNLPPKKFRIIAEFEAAKQVRDTANQVKKAGAFILDEDSQHFDPLANPVMNKASEVQDKHAVQPLGMPVARMSFSPVPGENDDPNANALAALQLLNTDRGGGRGKKVIPRSLQTKLLPPVDDASPDSSPILPPDRRSTRRPPFDLQKQDSPPSAPASDDQPLQPVDESDEDDVPIARTVIKRRQEAKIHDSSKAETAGTSAVKKDSKATTLSKSTTLLPPDDSDEEDESVSPVRPSIEDVEKQCRWFINGHTCTKYHSKDGLIHDEALREISRKRRASLDIPSTASPGKESSPRASSSRDSRSASAFTRPDSADAPHLPPTATGGRIHGTPAAHPQQASEYATVLSSTARRSVESSPLSEISSDLAEELEEFHTAQATAGGSRQESTDMSRSGTEMTDALLMPPPQTVMRRLDFAAPAPERGYVPPVFKPTKGKSKGKRVAEGSGGGGKGKKVRKTTPEDTPSRPRGAVSKSASPAADDDDEDEEDETIVVEETPRATPRTTPTRRQGRKASRPRYAESKSTPHPVHKRYNLRRSLGSSTNRSDDGGPGSPTIAERTRSSRTPSSDAGDDIQDRETESNLFRGMAFAISYKRSDENAVKDREEVTKLILSHGGEVIEDFKDLFEKTDIDGLTTPAVSRTNSTNTSFITGSRRGSAQPNPAPAGNDDDDDNDGELGLTEHAMTLGFVAFIGDTYSRKSKFLQALALGLPCLSSFFIRECVRTKSILRWLLFMLQAGEPRKMQGMIVTRFIQPYSAVTARFEDTFRDRNKMLEGMGVLFLLLKSGRGKTGADNKLKREHYLWLTRALGARSVRRVQTVAVARRLITEASDAEEPGQGWDIVYVDDGDKVESVKRDVGMSKVNEEERKVRVVSDEFVVQSLILGGLEDEDLKDEAWVDPAQGNEGEEQNADQDVDMEEEEEE